MGAFMKSFTVGSWNLKDSDINLSSNRRKAASIIGLLEDKEVDILALQKINNSLVLRLYDELKETGYHLDRSSDNSLPILPGNLFRSNYVIIRNDYLFTSQIKKTSDFMDTSDKTNITNLNIVDVKADGCQIRIINTNVNENKYKARDGKFEHVAQAITKVKEETVDNSLFLVTGDLNETSDANSLRKINKYINQPNGLEIFNEFALFNPISSYIIGSNSADCYETVEIDDYSRIYENKPMIAKVLVK
jgi:hypothetical protein